MRKSLTLWLVAFASLHLLAGGPISRSGDGTPRRHPTTVPLTFSIESGDLTMTYTNPVIGPLVRSAFQQWNDVPGSTLAIQEGAPVGFDITTMDQIFDVASTGLNPVVFDATGDIAGEFGVPPSAIAFAGPLEAGLPNFAAMFVVMGGPGAVGQLESRITSTLLHEIGHALGLGHSTVNGYLFGFRIDYLEFGRPPEGSVELMYWQAVARTTTVNRDDLSGYLALYGNTAQGAAGLGAISGTVFLPDGVTPVDGINVVVRDRSGGTDTVFTNAASVITAPNGTGAYTIRALPPGEYSIELNDIGFGNLGSYSDPIRTDNNGSPSFVSGPFPGDPEFYNGENESNRPETDDPDEVATVTVNADTTVSGIDIFFNREEGSKGTLLSQSYIVPEVQTDGEGDTLLHIINPSSTGSRLFDVYGFDAAGEEVGRASLPSPLGPLAKIVAGVKQMFPENFADVAWLQVGSDGQLRVFAEIARPNTITAFWAANGLSQTAFMPHVAKNTASFATFLSTVNGQGEALETTVTPQPGGSPVTIPEHNTGFSKSKNDVRNLFGDDLSAVDWVQIQSSGGLGQGTASMEYFAVLPAQSRIASLGLDSESGNVLRFLHVAKDVSQFFTGLVYINVGTLTANITETYYGDDGSVISTRDLQLDPGAKVDPPLLFDADNTEPLNTAWIEVTSDQPLVGYELFGNPITVNHDYFAGLQGSYTSGTAIDYPYSISSPTRFTGLVALNVGGEPGTLRFTAYNAAGQALEENLQPEPLGSKVKFTVLVRGLFSQQTLADTAWIRATSTASQWAGFLLWGDTGVPSRQLLAGINGAVSNLIQDPPGVSLVTEVEDNNTYETAQVLTRQGSAWNINVVGFSDQLEANTPVDADGDDVEDIYTFTLDQPTQLIIACSPEVPAGDLDLFVARGQFPLTSNLFDDLHSQDNFDWSAFTSGDESIMRIFPAGTYYVMVSNWDSNQNPVKQTEYGLLITETPLFWENFDDPDIGPWSVGALQLDNDGTTEWAFAPDINDKFNNSFANLNTDAGREAGIAISPEFEIVGENLTIYDTDFSIVFDPNQADITTFAFGVEEWPGDQSISLFNYTANPGLTNVSFNGENLASVGWQSWASNFMDPSTYTLDLPDGTMTSIALGADHVTGFVMFDNVRVYSIITSLSTKSSHRKGLQIGRQGMGYGQKKGKGSPSSGKRGSFTLQNAPKTFR